MLSFVVPVYNEEESIDKFYAELKNEADKFKKPYEILFIDDGSRDTTLKLLKSLAANDSAVHVYSFLRNHGKAEALTLGFQKAKGDIIITLDADLQDKPSEMKKLLEKQEKDELDFVSGWRKDRKDKKNMVIISRLFNYFTGSLFGVHLHDYNCGLKLYTADAAKSLRLYGGQHRFIPLLIHQQGYRIGEVVVEHEKRKYGKSKYGFSKIKDLPDMFTMLFLNGYSRKPLHFFGPIGGLFSLSGLLILIYLTYIKMVYNVSIGRRPLLLLGILLIVAGLQVLFTGFIAELIVNTHQKNFNPFPLRYSSDNS